MGYLRGFMILMICINGCSEFRMIGDAAMREFRADAITVNWIREDTRQVEKRNEPFIDHQSSTTRESTFSTFRDSQQTVKKPQKGLWEQRSVGNEVR